jgi:superfamily II RNA helicase
MSKRNISDLTGFPLDTFQNKALSVIDSGDDLLTTLPTGSGKTVVALSAIIRAFDSGYRAILTTPIKALSNQKYSEFQEWLPKAGYNNRITLLTGDIQSRATPMGGDGLPELLIMTSEILANKLQKPNDTDLVNVKVLVIDEMHYINDVERGHVWERTIMHLPKDIQTIALSATLSEPEKFQEWLNTRRPTQLIQRKDRHVPLHFGFYDSKQNFIELYSTKNENKIMDSNLYKKLQPQTGTFTQSIVKIVKILEKEEKLPAIIFLMSKSKCMDAANAITQQLLYGPRPTMDKDDDPLAFGEIESEHTFTVKTIRNQQDELYRKYLQPYDKMLSKLPQFNTFKAMLDRGVAYHHAGLIPILREYVEILFSKRLLKVVFATESLAIGINMPTKCVVFTGLEKPNGIDSNMVPLRPEQFIQMAGRSGRRGIDTIGYVVYYPIKNIVSDGEFRQLLFGKMPAAISTLDINPIFVLKNMDDDIIKKSLLYHQHNRYIKTLQDKVDKYQVFDKTVEEQAEKYNELKDRLKPSLFKLANNDRKKIEKEIHTISNSVGEANLQNIIEKMKDNNELEYEKIRLNDMIEASKVWLNENQFIDTIRGKIAMGLSDGCPLSRATMIEQGYLNKLSFEEIVGWFGFFTENIKASNMDDMQLEVLDCIYETIDSMQENTQSTSYTSGLLLHMWAKNKDISEICNNVDFGNMGTFIRCVLRVISFIDEIKPVLLGLEFYELYNKLENHMERLMDGIVTNSSLYIK